MPAMSRYAQGVGVDILCWADFSSRESLLRSNADHLIGIEPF
jgi:hypothetical protein